MTNAEIANAVKNAKSFAKAKEIVRNVLREDKAWQVRTMLFLFERQTASEQQAEQTALHNDVGFNSSDATILTSFAKQWLNREWLSDKQMAILQRKIVKYAGQVTRKIRGEREPATA
jgi:hypothetical protein